MKIFTKDNALAVAVTLLILAGLVLVGQHTSHAEGGTPLVSREYGSQYVSSMPEAKVLQARHISQISVLCEKTEPKSGFLVQVGYWQDGNPKTIQTQKPCRYWGQDMALLRQDSSWQVRSAPKYDKEVYADVVRLVHKDSAPKT